jgi:hypothetical protein
MQSEYGNQCCTVFKISPVSNPLFATERLRCRPCCGFFNDGDDDDDDDDDDKFSLCLLQVHIGPCNS